MNLQTATFAGGCFWCTEAIFQRLKGVKSVVSGYSGGNKENPLYEEVSEGTTGHAEAIQIEFDSTIIPFKKLVEIFFHLHDPTTKNQQGADVGTQYRSAIFYHDEKQKVEAEEVKEKIENEKVYQNPIITEIEKFTGFYPAEGYHQNYYNNNKEGGYCQVVINPKIQKLLREFKENVKDNVKE